MTALLKAAPFCFARMRAKMSSLRFARHALLRIAAAFALAACSAPDLHSAADYAGAIRRRTCAAC